ncbi:MAG TPA: class I SAM-dependent methyltransferase [Pseudonocardia sp.]|nr:class I SAM-dependent methyltransferase [Pseudonocardia sp.]
MLRRLFGAVVRPAYVWLRRGSTDLLFERRYGVRTSGEVDLETLGIASADRERYQPVGWIRLRQVLPRRSVTAEDVFLDLGCGMGRALILASTYPFRRVIGVELSARLAEIARHNAEHARVRRRCGEVLVVEADALDYEIPDDVTVVFLNNPFRGPVFAAVVENVLASHDRRPRRLRIVYGNPIEEPTLLATGRVELVRVVRGLRPGEEWSRSNSFRCYEVRGPVTAPPGSGAPA